MDANEGLDLAIWDDGTVLFSPSEELGYAMLVGRIEPREVKSLLEVITGTGLFNCEEPLYVVDSSYSALSVRGFGTRSWHEFLMPGYGGDIDTDEKYRRFVIAWRRCIGAIESITPTSLRRLEAPEFRGYVAERPFDTPWRE